MRACDGAISGGDGPVDPVRRWPCVVFVIGLLGLYGPTLVGLASDWITDDNYAHGILVPPFVAWLVWQRRDRLRDLPVRPSAFGAWMVAAGLLLYLLGQTAFEFFLTRVSLLVVMAGALVYLFGWRHLRACAFPFVLVALAIPLPALIFNEIALPLQLVASRLGVGLLDLAQVPAIREGNVIYLPQATLEVAEACSGVRSLMSLGTLALVYGYLARPSLAARSLVLISVLPAVIVANGLRVAASGLVAHRFGADAALGPLHAVAGWIFFGTALLLIAAVDRASSAWPGGRVGAVAGEPV